MPEVYRDAAHDDNPETAEVSMAAPFRIDIVTVLPEMFVGPLDCSILGRGRAAGLLDIRIHDLREWALDRHRSTDDAAYGGGGGMVMKPDPVFLAVESILGMPPASAEHPAAAPCPIILTTPQGRPFDHEQALAFSQEPRILILCGHYEGFDERIRAHLATHEVSVGDFVLTGGEIPAMLIADATARLRPGVVGSEHATSSDSFAGGLLEHPHYTRPADFRGWTVPDRLLSGHHGEVARWRRRESLRRTFERRPELLLGLEMDEEQRAWLTEWGRGS
jgi:tRNA (guanine37-N1)-methyltransferase